jgi:P27 family predicted phage terminase small subunit
MSKPAEIHKLEGTFRKDRHSDDVKAPMMGEMPTAPLNMSDEAAEWWRKKCIDLQQMGMLYRSDLELLANYCNLLADIDDARKRINESATGDDRLKWLKYHNEALKYALPMTKEFGFTPLARTKIKLNKTEEPDDFDKL